MRINWKRYLRTVSYTHLDVYKRQDKNSIRRYNMKKLTTAKIWQFAAGQFGWAMLSGIISNWLVYFYQPDKTAISQGQTVFIPQGLVVLGIFTIIGGITAFGRIFDAFTDPMIASWSDRCTSCLLYTSRCV